MSSSRWEMGSHKWWPHSWHWESWQVFGGWGPSHTGKGKASAPLIYCSTKLWGWWRMWLRLHMRSAQVGCRWSPWTLESQAAEQAPHKTQHMMLMMMALSFSITCLQQVLKERQKWRWVHLGQHVFIIYSWGGMTVKYLKIKF